MMNNSCLLNTKTYLFTIERLSLLNIRRLNFNEFKNSRAVNLKASKGWVKRNDQYMDQFQTQKYAPAIYSHCYDDSGTRLFASGGPLQIGLEGNYMGLWQWWHDGPVISESVMLESRLHSVNIVAEASNVRCNMRWHYKHHYCNSTPHYCYNPFYSSL